MIIMMMMILMMMMMMMIIIYLYLNSRSCRRSPSEGGSNSWRSRACPSWSVRRPSCRTCIDRTRAHGALFERQEYLPSSNRTAQHLCENKRTQNIKNKRTPNIKNKRTPNIKNKRIPNIKNKRTPNIKNKRTPNIKNKRTPNIKNKRTPNIKNKRTPSIKNKRTPNIKNETQPERKFGLKDWVRSTEIVSGMAVVQGMKYLAWEWNFFEEPLPFEI